MQDPVHGVSIRNRKRNLRTFEDCFKGLTNHFIELPFIATSAVSWVAKHLKVNRKKAIAFLQYFVNRHIIYCVSSKPSAFKDDNSLYKFQVCPYLEIITF